MIVSKKLMATLAAAAFVVFGSAFASAQDAPADAPKPPVVVENTDVQGNPPPDGGNDGNTRRGGGMRGAGRNFDPAAMFKRMDANGDGKIQKSEFKGPEEFFKTLDTDGDGNATQEEFTKAREMRRGQGGPGQGGPGAGGPGGWGRGPRVDIDDLKEQLGVNDEEWSVLKPALEKLTTRPEQPATDPVDDLRKVLENKEATAEEIKAKVTAVRDQHTKRDADRKAAREAVRELVTPRQEAILITQGLLD